MPTLPRDTLQPTRYRYLDQPTSDVYDLAKQKVIKQDEANKIIVTLIERMADMIRGVHAASRL